mmetsp:Transcript_131263/g.379726  ORF Transcript_131263/g.379726 Transcript_131263/m.379726 type:complete len:248 (+) Transcript_131263:60-803(+)
MPGASVVFESRRGRPVSGRKAPGRILAPTTMRVVETSRLAGASRSRLRAGRRAAAVAPGATCGQRLSRRSDKRRRRRLGLLPRPRDVRRRHRLLRLPPPLRGILVHAQRRHDSTRRSVHLRAHRRLLLQMSARLHAPELLVMRLEGLPRCIDHIRLLRINGVEVLLLSTRLGRDCRLQAGRLLGEARRRRPLPVWPARRPLGSRTHAGAARRPVHPRGLSALLSPLVGLPAGALIGAQGVLQQGNAS